jgi:hypothetical protein
MRSLTATLVMAASLLVACDPLRRSDSAGAPPLASLSYDDARSLANSSESSLSGDAMFQLRHASGKVLGNALVACERPQMDLAGFTVVLALGADGSVTHTWRKGDTPLAVCVQEQLSRSKVVGNWPSPFYTSLVLSRHEP